jgi:multiple sugar transport system substrate-binding protein
MQPWLDEIEAEFEKLHPMVDLTLEMPSFEIYRDSLTTQAAGDNPPDVAQVALTWMPALADAGELVDWEQAIDQTVLDGIEPALLEGGRYEDGLYGLGYGSTARAVYYNADIFAAAGIAELPKTWDELLDAARKIKSSGAADVPFFYEGKGVEGMAAWFPYVYWSFGGELADAAGKLKIDEQACVEGLTVWDTMNNEGLFQPNVTASDYTQQREAFTAGRAAMTITSPSLIGILAADAPDLSYGTFPIPVGTTQATVGVVDTYVMFKDGKNPVAARAFIEFLMEPDRSLRFVRDRGFLPVFTEHFALDEFNTGQFQAFAESLPTAKFVPLASNWPEFDKVGSDAITAMVLDGTGSEKACQKMIDFLAGLDQ